MNMQRRAFLACIVGGFVAAVAAESGPKEPP